MLEQKINYAITKVYPACVKLYAFDSVAKRQAGGQFSGVVVSADGRIMTAAHVETPGVCYKVICPDGREALATGLGRIALNTDKTVPDVAMIKITTAGTWPFAALGNSANLAVKQFCISISYPEALGQPKPILRFGYITMLKSEKGFIKSTCMMEPGDSGGGLFDEFGQLIGLHSGIEVPESNNYDVPVNLYIKYRTALNLPESYTNFPVPEGALPAVALHPGIAGFSLLKKAGKAMSFEKTCVAVIHSTMNGFTQKIYGTVIVLKENGSKTGYGKQVVISKNSLVGTDPLIICSNHTKIKARVIARDRENDLVLLVPVSAVAGGLPVAKLKETGEIREGKFLISPQPDSTAALSISGSSAFSLNKVVNAPFLGMAFESGEIPLKVAYLFPNLNSSIYQMQLGDEILAINGFSSTSLGGYLKNIRQYWPGDTVNIQIARAGVTMTKSMLLDTLPQQHFNHPVEFFNGGKSRRRDGFKHVFTHDAILTLGQCGGPVFDLCGNFYGINIARYSRASCLAMPCSVIAGFLNKAMAN